MELLIMILFLIIVLTIALCLLCGVLLALGAIRAVEWLLDRWEV